MEYEDKTIQCKNCGDDFTWSAGEQSFYAKKGFNSPVRCKKCREIKKQQRA